MSINKALAKFDKHIAERKRYIKLLEEYLSIIETFDQDQLVVYDADSDSTDDTGFDSVTSSLESLFFSSNYGFSTYV